jgi:hypothetical protein
MVTAGSVMNAGKKNLEPVELDLLTKKKIAPASAARKNSGYSKNIVADMF